MREQYWDATHNVYAYIIRDGATRFSDDGEPGGTAGMPVLQVLQREELYNVTCVVTRYFGGILLGAGGLVRAYAHGAKIAVDAAGRSIKRIWTNVYLPCPYSWYERIRLEVAAFGGMIRETRVRRGCRAWICCCLRSRRRAFLERVTRPFGRDDRGADRKTGIPRVPASLSGRAERQTGGNADDDPGSNWNGPSTFASVSVRSFPMPRAAARGRRRRTENDVRTCYQRDSDRILHSKSFRRLMHKTQVFLQPEGDHYRTRMTHTLEVARIARTITRALRLNEDLAEAIAFGHDLGHTPFGHAGEVALTEVMGEPFRHNEQSLRVVDVLEKDGQGLNLTYEVRMGILGHSSRTAACRRRSRARSSANPTRSPISTTTSTTRCAPGS